MKNKIALCILIVVAFYFLNNYAAVNSKLIHDKYGSGEEDTLGGALAAVWVLTLAGQVGGFVFFIQWMFGIGPKFQPGGTVGRRGTDA